MRGRVRRAHAAHAVAVRHLRRGVLVRGPLHVARGAARTRAVPLRLRRHLRHARGLPAAPAGLRAPGPDGHRLRRARPCKRSSAARATRAVGAHDSSTYIAHFQNVAVKSEEAPKSVEQDRLSLPPELVADVPMTSLPDLSDKVKDDTTEFIKSLVSEKEPMNSEGVPSLVEEPRNDGNTYLWLVFNNIVRLI